MNTDQFVVQFASKEREKQRAEGEDAEAVPGSQTESVFHAVASRAQAQNQESTSFLLDGHIVNLVHEKSRRGSALEVDTLQKHIPNRMSPVS